MNAIEVIFHAAGEIRQLIDKLNKDKAALENELADERARLIEIRASRDRAKRNLRMCTETLMKIRAERETLRAELRPEALARSERETEQVRGLLRAARLDLEREAAEAGDLKAQLKAMQRDREPLLAQLGQRNEAIKDLQAEIKALREKEDAPARAVLVSREVTPVGIDQDDKVVVLHGEGSERAPWSILFDRAKEPEACRAVLQAFIDGTPLRVEVLK